MSRTIGVLLLLSILCACYTEGAYLKEQEVVDLENTIVTAEQLMERLGPPTVTIPREGGDTLWVYQGVYTTAGVQSYIPYVGLLVGTNNQVCTQLRVAVDNLTGALSDWQFKSENDTDHWVRADNQC